MPLGSIQQVQGKAHRLIWQVEKPLFLVPLWTKLSAPSATLVHDCTPLGLPLNCSFLSLSQPDLLNFKKGWLTKQYEDSQVSLWSSCELED